MNVQMRRATFDVSMIVKLVCHYYLNQARKWTELHFHSIFSLSKEYAVALCGLCGGCGGSLILPLHLCVVNFVSDSAYCDIS